ncbi:MAG: uracil phosphoribosyltransferase [Oscillospiraceae bacterium]|nr:uracil phosphoribosyltransferase [Oscillospiraceae bacterium]
MKNFFIIDHPLLHHKLSLLRDKRTLTKEFRELVSEISTLLCYEATRDLNLKEVEIETPLSICKTKFINNKIAFIPILRAGLGMVDGCLNLLPSAKIGHLGFYRDHKTLNPVEYYAKLPMDISQRDGIILDPIIATGGSMLKAISLLKEKNIKNIKIISILCSREGIENITKKHDDVKIYTAGVDDRLDKNGYIMPGIGDAGDRIFYTK